MRALVLALTVTLTGCVGGAAVDPAADPEILAAADAPAFSFAADGCEAGGFVATYQHAFGAPDTLAGVWKTADIREELGNPLRDGLGRPVISPLMGNWHIGIRCASATSDGATTDGFFFGWVGQMVEPPAWDVGGADLHFLLTGLALQNGTIADGLRATTTADVTHAFEVRMDWLAPRELPRSAIYTRFSDVERGVYESWSNMLRHREVPDRVLRFWWQVPADGTEATSGHTHSSGEEHGEFHPLFFDMRVGAGPQYLTPPQDALELGTHNMLKMEHGPGVLAQPTLTNVYVQPTLEFSTGPVFTDVVLHEIWTH